MPWVTQAQDICYAPNSITVTNISTNGAFISWHRGGTETTWELTVGDSIYHPIDTFFSVGNLESNTYSKWQ